MVGPFTMVIHQVCDHDRGYPPFTYISQVLTGKSPFPGLGMAEIALNAVQGVRPTKPKDASAIGSSDSLWNFVQHCWDGKMKLRPKVGEVVSQLERAAADWGRVMPPCAPLETVAPAWGNQSTWLSWVQSYSELWNNPDQSSTPVAYEPESRK